MPVEGVTDLKAPKQTAPTEALIQVSVVENLVRIIDVNKIKAGGPRVKQGRGQEKSQGQP